MKIPLLSTLGCALVLGLAGCGGSQTEVSESPIPPPVQQQVVNYSGPAPSTDDVQNFKLALWDNMASADRCGACHVQDDQDPAFARFDDINLAYSEANDLVNLSRPSESRLVTKVAEGHNCWLSSDDACGDIMTTWVSNWAGASDQAAQGTQIQLQAPVLRAPGANKNFPSTPDLFADTVHPLMETYCAQCHTSSATIPIGPYFASSDLDEAYQASRSRINLDNPDQSRLVVRLRDEFHNCWSNCLDDAAQLVAAIQTMADGIELTELDPSLVNSNALTLFDGTLASGGGRVDANVIAKWEFKAGSGTTAFDTSGVDPALDLTISGQFSWVGGYGIQLVDGKAQGATSASAKLHDLITATGEFAVEAWVAPANVTQEGPARIVSYSGGRDRRNLTLAQTLYNYDALLRTANTDSNGQPALSTADADEDLQAALQHVVMNYDPINGRRLYVNGVFTDDVDSVASAGLNDWDDSFALVLGNEVSGDVPWAGTLRMVAIHNRALSGEQILKNFDAGIGQRFFLLFGVSDVIGQPESYVVFEVSQFDSYSYLFAEPFFINLNGDFSGSDIPLSGMRLGVNGRESTFGQGFATLDTSLSASAYISGEGQLLSRQGTIIPVEKGPEVDEFFLTFERLGDQENVRIDNVQPAPFSPADLPPQPDIGMRDFAEINASMASLTTVPRARNSVYDSFAVLQQQLPAVTAMDSFLASHQMAVTQLAIKYCDELVEDSALRNAYFPSFDFNRNANGGFDPGQRDALLSPLLARMIGGGLLTQPQQTAVKNELNNLIDRLTECGPGSQCDATYTRTVVKASCAAVLGSAAITLQ